MVHNGHGYRSPECFRGLERVQRGAVGGDRETDKFAKFAAASLACPSQYLTNDVPTDRYCTENELLGLNDDY